VRVEEICGDRTRRSYEKEYLHKDGTRAVVRLRRQLTRGQHLALEFCVDISDRKKAEEALQETKIDSAALIEQACDAFFFARWQCRFLELTVSCEVSATPGRIASHACFRRRARDGTYARHNRRGTG